MARAIDANELEMFPYAEVAGTEEQIADWIEQVGLSGDDTASRARNLCWKVIEGFINVVKTQPTLTPPNEWVSVEERLPEVGQEVLVYWRNTSQKAEHFELTHYDGDHWFLLDNTERPWIVVVAWIPLPAPPDRRPPERQEDT